MGQESELLILVGDHDLTTGTDTIYSAIYRGSITIFQYKLKGDFFGFSWGLKCQFFYLILFKLIFCYVFSGRNYTS